MQTPQKEQDDRVEDGELIARCLGGDEESWELLIRRYRRLVYSIPVRYGMGEEVAADVFQSVCLVLLENLAKLKDRGKLGSWLITTTTRECWRVSHRLRREAPIGEGGTDDDDGRGSLPELPDERPLAEEEQLQLEEQARVRAAVEQLPERCRSLVELLYYAEEGGERPSYEEISRRLGMPVPSIGPTRARCLEKLRKLLS